MRQDPEPVPDQGEGPAASPPPAAFDAPFLAMRYDQTDPANRRQLDLTVPLHEESAPRGPAVPAELAHERFVRRERPRRWFLPIFLFLATCISTFWAGATNGVVWPELNGLQLVEHWREGLLYMAAVLAILLTHEMGHFLQALRYGVPASLPYFIPMPFTPLGTMGAVIGMNGLQANRRELFDIGLSGPIAGLIVAIPITCIGILQAEASFIPAGGDGVLIFHDPLLVKWLIQWLRPEIPTGHELALNAWLRAGWVGMLITGLNMMPVSQLDGGHVTYALFGRGAHWIARMFLFLAVVAMIYTHTYMWMAMVFVVFLIGPDHPPTADDEAPLGPARWLLGFASLAIPILCFPPLGLSGL